MFKKLKKMQSPYHASWKEDCGVVLSNETILSSNVTPEGAKVPFRRMRGDSDIS